jgi:hypothetical protein
MADRRMFFLFSHSGQHVAVEEEVAEVLEFEEDRDTPRMAAAASERINELVEVQHTRTPAVDYHALFVIQLGRIAYLFSPLLSVPGSMPSMPSSSQNCLNSSLALLMT